VVEIIRHVVWKARRLCSAAKLVINSETRSVNRVEYICVGNLAWSSILRLYSMGGLT
jgi:hypothetical protein